FYDGDQGKYNFGIGQKFFSTVDGAGYTWTRADAKEIEKFLSLIGIDSKYLLYKENLPSAARLRLDEHVRSRFQPCARRLQGGHASPLRGAHAHAGGTTDRVSPSSRHSPLPPRTTISAGSLSRFLPSRIPGSGTGCPHNSREPQTRGRRSCCRAQADPHSPALSRRVFRSAARQAPVSRVSPDVSRVWLSSLSEAAFRSSSLHQVGRTAALQLPGQPGCCQILLYRLRSALPRCARSRGRRRKD